MFSAIRVTSSRAARTIVAVFSDGLKLPTGFAAEADLKSALKTPGFKGDAGEFILAGDRFALLGMGKRADFKLDVLRIIAARLIKALERSAATGVKLVIAQTIGTAAPIREAGRAFGEAMGIANWRVDFFDGAATNRQPAAGTIRVEVSHKVFREGLIEGLALAECVNEARRLGATPPNICTPAWIAGEARKLARRTGLKCRVIEYAQAKKLGMGGLVNVGQASASKPRLIILEHRPRRASSARHLVLVGKTLTYDTGGYSLKVNNGMKGMKYDKCGGMAVLGAMQAIASRNIPVNVTALLPAAENMVGGDAFRPDDIITFYNGVTCEVTNTDAEGRLVLADALAYACEKYAPTAIVDVATLTGGVVVALGSWCAGLFCNDDGLRNRVEAAAAASGERVWRLPLWKEHQEFMRSPHADILNSNAKRDGHPLQGAAFLSYFVDPQVPWAHIDIAGTAAVEAPSDLYVTGPTGYGVRLLADLAESFS
jgi:leucyl aminopeptidase